MHGYVEGASKLCKSKIKSFCVARNFMYSVSITWRRVVRNIVKPLLLFFPFL